jgi:serine/threonine-protein kinase
MLQMLIEKKGFVKDFKVDFKRRDGSIVTILLTANLYKSPDGKTVGYEGLNIPLTEVDIPTRLWHHLTMPLRKLLRRRSNFLSVSRVSELVANQYEKVEELSEGFYTSVWRGRDVLGFEESPLVIKISKNTAINDRLLIEGQVLRKLAGHPGVPELVDVARHKGRTVVITRYVEGTTLEEMLPVADTATRDRLAWQLMDVAAHLHENEVVHRDIKPGNVVVRSDGTMALLDYGIVKRMGEGVTSSTIIGTRPYMSPEQIDGKSEIRSDVWAIGVVLYQLYTGRMPFVGNTEMELMENILHTEPPVPRSLNPDLRAQLEGVLIQALRKKPEGRYDNAGHMRDEVVKLVPGFADNVADLVEAGGKRKREKG